jgi:hypothetical protein
MALHSAGVNFVTIVLFFAASANVVTFEPHLLGKPDHTTDLLLLVDESKSLGKDSLGKALQTVDDDHSHSERQRHLLVAKCIGCAQLDQLKSRYHLTRDDLPMVFLYPLKSEDTRSGKFGLPLKGVSTPAQAMNNFIAAFDAQELKPWVRSLPEPSEQQQGPARIVVGSSFEKEIIDVDKHVVLLVHGDHDAASKDLLPIFEELGTILGQKPPASQHGNDDEENDIVGFEVARFSKDGNEVPPSVNIAISQGPEIFLFRDDDKGDPDQFPQSEKPTRESIVRWLHEMLPQRNYGLDPFFAKISTTPSKSKEIREHPSSQEVEI